MPCVVLLLELTVPLLLRHIFIFLAVFHTTTARDRYAIAVAGKTIPPVNMSNVWIIGCDGGFDKTCTPTIKVGG